MLKAAASKVRHVSASIHTARGAYDVGKPCTVSVGNHHISLAGVRQIQSIVLILASQAQPIITDAQQLSTGSNCCACKQDYRLRLRSLGPADRLRLRAAGAGEALPLGEPTGLARRGERLLGGLSSRLQTYRSNSSSSDGRLQTYRSNSSRWIKAPWPNNANMLFVPKAASSKLGH